MESKKVIVITGASDGIGAEAARFFAAQNWHVVIVGRSEEKCEKIGAELGVPSYSVDFTQLDQVRNLADTLRNTCGRIDVLANNAGGLFAARELTPDGHEKTMQVNHLAHFLLTRELLDLLLSSRATVINTSSVAHRIFSDFDIDDLDLETGYTARKAYGNAKLANILFTRELSRRYAERGLSAAAFHPGNVATNFASESTGFLRWVYHTPLRHIAGLISPEQGADTLIYLATARPGEQWESGGYYVKRKKRPPKKEARDDRLARLLWEKSEQMVDRPTARS